MIGNKLSLAVGGQSLAAMFMKHGRNAFALRLKRVTPKAPGVFIWGFAQGGSTAASTNARLGMRSPASYLWDMGADAPSPEFLAGMDANAAFFESPCECLFWDQGQSDATAASGVHGHDPDVAVQDYIHATTRILATWRARLAPAAPETVPIIIMPHAPHPAEGGSEASGVLRIRAAQYELMRSITNCHDAGLIEKMAMRDNLHPNTDGILTYSFRVAEAFARVVSTGRTVDPRVHATAEFTA